jgi:hypothetical protein
MTRLTWDAIGERFYEGGVDHGVLFVGGRGVAWPGLVSVSESANGGEPRPFYIDGYKYLNLASSEEFEATIEAFSAPPEFAPCDGINAAYAGLLITQQPRRPFAFSYRTKVGNDEDGLDHGYKIHLVYNALAAPSERTYTTVGQSAEAPTRSWSLTTLAPKIHGYRPTAHFVIDSRTTSPVTLAAIEDILYGTETVDPEMPTVTELMTLFGAPVYDGGDNSVVIVDEILDGGLP